MGQGVVVSRAFDTAVMSALHLAEMIGPKTVAGLNRVMALNIGEMGLVSIVELPDLTTNDPKKGGSDLSGVEGNPAYKGAIVYPLNGGRIDYSNGVRGPVNPLRDIPDPNLNPPKNHPASYLHDGSWDHAA